MPITPHGLGHLRGVAVATLALAAASRREPASRHERGDTQPARVLLRFATGVAFTAIGCALWIEENDVHVLMSGVGAIGFGVGNLLRPRTGRSGITAFFAGWMLVYTVLIGSAMLMLMPGVRGTPGPAEWIHHIAVTAVLLAFFGLGRPHMASALTGFWSALVSTPFMLYLTAVQPVLTLDDPISLIPVCALSGVGLIAAHHRVAGRPVTFARQLVRLRWAMLVVLEFYTVATLGTLIALA